MSEDRAIGRANCGSRIAAALLGVKFEDGAEYALSAEYLRVMSPSAEVQGHRAADRVTVGGKRHCAIIGIEPVGTYAVRLSFDDMHSTGILHLGLSL